MCFLELEGGMNGQTGTVAHGQRDHPAYNNIDAFFISHEVLATRGR